MKKSTITILLSLLVMGLAATAFSWGGGPGAYGRGPGYGPCTGGDLTALSSLSLTAEQTEKIDTLRDSLRKEIKPFQDKIYSYRGDLKLLWLEKSPDQEKILAVQKNLRSVRDQLQDKMTVHRLAILKILTPEQQNKIKSYAGRGMGRGSGMGRGPMMGGCPGQGGGPGYGPGPRGN
jgi:zinc resistance-associated protein